MRRLLVVILALALLPVIAQGQSKQADCKKWGKLLFFEKASPSRVRECLAQGASLSDFRNGLTPLSAAVFGRTPYPEVVALLIQSGADVSAHSRAVASESTPLHHAVLASLRHPERIWAVRMLLEAGADVNARNMFGKTPLHHAVGVYKKKDTSDLARVLIEAGADVNAITDKGESAMNLTREPRVRSVLAQAGGLNAPKKRKTKSGLGALATGVLSATVANAAGLDEEAALAVGQDLADSVKTGQPTNRAMTQVARQREAERRLAERIAAENAALLEALKAEVASYQGEPDSVEQSQAAQRRRQAEQRLQALAEQRERMAEQARDREKVLNSGCKCIRIKDNGEYSCLDGLVVGNNASGKPLCDIKR